MSKTYNAFSKACGTYITCTNFVITTTASASATSSTSQKKRTTNIRRDC